jgi:AraC-like DNA-binding protein
VLASQELSAVRNLVAFAKDEPGLGASAATRFQLGTLGVWGLAMMSCRTVRESVEIAMRQGYGKFSWGMLAASVERHGRDLRAVFDEHGAPSDVRNFLIERDLAFTFTALDKLLGRRASLVVETTLDQDRVRRLRELLGPRVLRVGAPRNAIWLPGSTLDLPLPNGDAYAMAMCERQCEELLERRQWQAPPVSARAKVEAVLMRLPPASWTLENVAGERYVHPRTLNRLLAAERTSFRAIVDERREALASAMLAETDLSVGEIARRVGYAETPSFVRAYRRWTGRTPGAVRRGAQRRADG